MPESPRTRRMRSDARAMEQLRAESTIIDYTPVGNPPDKYVVQFLGAGLWRPEGGPEVVVRERHEVVVGLGASYPRMMPELQWRTPIFHPNISGSGVVCLGGYGTYWVPSLSLDELCVMLWDMIRYQNYDVESPYNREAALWAKTQQSFRLPVDDRPLRNRVKDGLVDPGGNPDSLPVGGVSGGVPVAEKGGKPPILTAPPQLADDELIFIDDTSTDRAAAEADVADAEVVDAEIVEGEDPDIMFIE